VIAPKEEPISPPQDQPLPPGVPGSQPMPSAPIPRPQHTPNFNQQHRFHPYQRFSGPRKQFDYNRVGGMGFWLQDNYLYYFRILYIKDLGS